MQNERLCLSPDLSGLLPGQWLHIFIPQKRIQPVQIPGDENLLRKLHEHIGQKIEQEIPGEHDHRHLEKRHRDLGDRIDIRLNVIALLGIAQAVLVGDKIRTDRIEQKDQIINRHLPHGNGARILDEIFQEGRNRKSDPRHHQCDDRVCLPVHLHVGLDLLCIFLSHGPVEREVQRRPDAKLCHRQDGQDIRIERIDPEKLLGEMPDENRTENKGHQRGRCLSEVSECNISLCQPHPSGCVIFLMLVHELPCEAPLRFCRFPHGIGRHRLQAHNGSGPRWQEASSRPPASAADP